MGKGRERMEGPQALTKSSCGARCALKGLRKIDLSRATRGSAKTSTLANLADS